MNKLPRLQGLLDTLINPNLRKNKVLKILNKNEKYLKQYQKELTQKMKGLKC